MPRSDITTIAVAVVEHEGRVLIGQRPSGVPLAGFWEFPGGKREAGETLEACLKREISEELDLSIEVGARLISVHHAYTHFRIILHVYICRYLSGEIKPIGCDDFRWVTEAELDNYAFPAADRKVIEKLKNREFKR